MNPEKLILSCILNDQGIHDVVIPELKPEYFSTDRELLGKVMEMYRKSRAIDTYTLIAECPDHRDEILGLSNLVASAGNVMEYIARLKDDYLRSQARKYFGAELGIGDDPYDYLADKVKELSDLQESITPHFHRSLLEIINDTLIELDKSRAESFGVPTPLTELNNLTNGWQPADLIILAGRPSRGKTAFALANVRTACEMRKRVAVFSLEMKDTQLMKRIIWSMEECRYDEAGGKISGWYLDIFEKGGIDISYIVGNSRLISRTKGLDMIVIDYLGLMKLPKAENRAYSIGEATRSLKALAKELNIPVMLLCQLNRDIDKRTGRKHELSDLRESGDIEQDADVVIFISRPYMDGILEDKDGSCTEFLTVIQVEKNRNGKAPLRIKARNNERVNFYSDWDVPDQFTRPVRDFSEPRRDESF